mgnify:CR=1 FL=1
MICRNCGKEIDDNATECIYCGCPTGIEEEIEENDEIIAEAAEDRYQAETAEQAMPEAATPAVPVKSVKTRSPKTVSNSALMTAISVLCAILSLICLVMTVSIRNSVAEGTGRISSQLDEIKQSSNALYSKLDEIDTTIADLTTNTNEQVARQAINLTKDITSLAGPVTEGKYNQMFILNAQGDLSLTSSFDWQKYNELTGSWESIPFTGDATTNEELGLRYGITKAAAGRYRCVITNVSGVSIRSSEAVVEIAAQ